MYSDRQKLNDLSYRRRNRKILNERWKEKAYGITPAQYQRLLDEQEDGCAICGIPKDEKGRDLDVDHCHKTGEIRGLLCQKCNRTLGLMNDDPARLREAADYLEGKGSKVSRLVGG